MAGRGDGEARISRNAGRGDDGGWQLRSAVKDGKGENARGDVRAVVARWVGGDSETFFLFMFFLHFCPSYLLTMVFIQFLMFIFDLF